MPLATSNFLVPNGTFIVVLIAFIIVLYVITKYVLPPLNKALTERQEQIRGELEAADKAKADAEEADVERRAVLEQARSQAREIVGQAQTTADQIVTSATAEGQAIHDRIVASAEAEVVVARQAAVEEVTARVGEIVLAAAERVIGREIQAVGPPGPHRRGHRRRAGRDVGRRRRRRGRPVNPALQGYLAAMEESLSADGGLADAGAQLQAFADIVEGNNALLLAVNDGSVPVAARRAVLDHLLEGKARPEVARLVHQAVSVVPAGELVTSFRWMGSRLTPGRPRGRHRRRAVRRGDPRPPGLAQPGVRLRRRRVRALHRRRPRGDRGPALPLRPDRRGQPPACATPSATATCPSPCARTSSADLLEGKALPATVRLAAYATRGGRARDIVATLDTLVEDAARARGWRVARVPGRRRRSTTPSSATSARRWPTSPATRSTCRSPWSPTCWAASSSRSATCWWTPAPATASMS